MLAWHLQNNLHQTFQVNHAIASYSKCANAISCSSESNCKHAASQSSEFHCSKKCNCMFALFESLMFPTRIGSEQARTVFSKQKMWPIDCFAKSPKQNMLSHSLIHVNKTQNTTWSHNWIQARIVNPLHVCFQFLSWSWSFRWPLQIFPFLFSFMNSFLLRSSPLHDTWHWIELCCTILWCTYPLRRPLCPKMS